MQGNLPQVSVRPNSLMKPDDLKLLRDLDERMPPSDAIDLATKLLAQYPNCKAEDGFIGALAQVIQAYAPIVARDIVHPLRGVAAKSEFLSIASVTAWLEDRSEPFWRQADGIRAAQAQLEDRQEHQTMLAAPAQALVQKTAAWLSRRDPMAKKLTGLTEQREREINEAQAKATDEAMEAARQRVEQEWAAAEMVAPKCDGIPISPELARMLARSND